LPSETSGIHSPGVFVFLLLKLPFHQKPEIRFSVSLNFFIAAADGRSVVGIHGLGEFEHE
jgi:hypothetical protein